MPNTCKVCKHPERERIDEMLVSDAPYRYIALQFSFAAMALYRHKADHLPVRLLRAKLAQEEAAADNILEQARALRTEVAVNDESGRLPPARVVLGLDLGISQDFTALAGLECSASGNIRQRGVRQFALGTPFKHVVAHVSAVFLRAPRNALLVVDSGGLGRPVVEHLRDELGGEVGRCVGVQITSGARRTMDHSVTIRRIRPDPCSRL